MRIIPSSKSVTHFPTHYSLPASLSRGLALVFVHSLFFSPLQAQSKSDCLTCHSDQSLSTERNGKTVSLFVDGKTLNSSAHGKLVCVACHAGFDMNNIPHKEKIEPITCMTCHKDAPQKHKFHPQMAKANGRNGTPDISCKQCHGKHDVVSPKVSGSKFHSSSLLSTCGACHTGVKETFAQSSHGKALAAGLHGTPNCITCHQNDITNIRPGRDSVQIKLAQERVCLSCHLDNPDVRAQMSPSVGFIAAYEQSVHGAALQKGNARVANCVDCHGSHEMRKESGLLSRTNRTNVAATCSKCHTEIGKEYSQSIHGVAARSGKTESAVCTDCHGEHNILRHTDPKSPVAARNVSSQVCSPCHSSVRLTQKYGIASDRFTTFNDSYHGLAIKGGSIEVANCASCHGSHNIKGAKDSTSSVYPANLATTCGKCHRGANELFAVGAVHVNVARANQDDQSLYWISTVYVILIVTVVGGMFAHNAADFIRKSRRKILIRRGIISEDHVGHHLYLRMTLSERLQHAAILLSFTALVITGFMLRYPDAWWVRSIRSMSTDVFDLRSLFHRIAAVVMVAASIYHVYYLFFTERGKSLIRDLMPKIQDARDAIAVVKFNFGFSKIKPQFGKFSYIEKSEYWALVWGTGVMAVTGFIMWFDNTFIGLLTKLGYDIARLIHFYEAWLATLSIIVWHFYYVIFNPDVYPINLAFFTGTITESEMADEHPLELQELRQKERAEEMIEVTGGGNSKSVPPAAPKKRK